MKLQGRWFTATLQPQPLTEQQAREMGIGFVFVPPWMADEFDRINAASKRAAAEGADVLRGGNGPGHAAVQHDGSFREGQPGGPLRAPTFAQL